MGCVRCGWRQHGGECQSGALSGVPPVPGYDVPLSTKARIFLVGITLDQVGQTAQGGAKQTLQTGQRVGREPAPVLGGNVDVMPGMLTINGAPVPTGVLITPHDGNGLTTAQVEQIITQAIVQARNVRSAIRLPVGGATSRMVLAVSDRDGEVLGLYRMTDSTIFSIDVSVAKLRNVTYYASADLQPFDRVRVNDPTGPFLPLGVAFTNRTFRFLAEPRFPAGVDGSLPGKFSILRESWVDRRNGYNLGAPVAKSAATITTVLAYDAFFVGTNFHDPTIPTIKTASCSSPAARRCTSGVILVGGFGVSGDGVDQDDVVTVSGQAGFAAPLNIRADRFFVRKVRLPYQKFDRNALRGSAQSHGGDQHVSSQRSFQLAVPGHCGRRQRALCSLRRLPPVAPRRLLGGDRAHEAKVRDLRRRHGRVLRIVILLSRAVSGARMASRRRAGAGNPRSLSCLARPSNGRYDDGYYVGGGCPCNCKADLRYCNEGTWGWDYVGHCFFPIVDLGYWHGRRDQSGNYKTDGPKISTGSKAQGLQFQKESRARATNKPQPALRLICCNGRGPPLQSHPGRSLPQAPT